MSTVLAFKLIGGDEVVAEVTEIVRNNVQMLTESVSSAGPIVSYTVRRPHVLRFQPVAPGQIGLAFVPWVLSNPEINSVTIPVEALLIPPFEASKNVEDQYLQQTSGIALAKAPSGRIST